jgi:endoglucanase
MRYIFETSNIAWANWDFKGGFAIFNFETGRPDKELIDVLLGPSQGE